MPGIDFSQLFRAQMCDQTAGVEQDNAATGIMCNCHHFSCWVSLCCPLFLLLDPLLAFQKERRWQSSIQSSLMFSCSRLRKWNSRAQGRQTLPLMLRSNPPPKKILCSARSSSSPSVTTATALESTVYIRHSSHLSIKACLNCQSIILHRELPTHLLLGMHPSHKNTCKHAGTPPNDTHKLTILNLAAFRGDRYLW